MKDRLELALRADDIIRRDREVRTHEATRANRHVDDPIGSAADRIDRAYVHTGLKMTGRTGDRTGTTDLYIPEEGLA